MNKEVAKDFENYLFNNSWEQIQKDWKEIYSKDNQGLLADEFCKNIKSLPHCPHCNSKVIPSIEKDYAWQCLNCDEDFIDSEVYYIK